MKKTTIITALTTLFLLTGCACVTTEYKAFEGVRDGIVDGKGGVKVVVDGMEVWDNGEPPRKFKILGFIDDRRELGWRHESVHRGDVVEKAREVGGDAVIKLHSQSQLERFYSAGGASANAYDVYSHAVRSDSPEKRVSKYVVIKYIK